MAGKKKTFVEVDLRWAEEQLATWKAYIDAHPFETLVDRMAYKETARGGVIPTIVANIESQIKSLRETMKDYLALLKEVDVMREAEDKKREIRGGDDLTPFEGGEI